MLWVFIAQQFHRDCIIGVRTHMIVAEVKVNVFLVEKAKGVCCLGCLGF